MSVFQKYRYWVDSAKYTTIQKLAILLMGIVSFKLLATKLGLSDYGVWGLFILISSITETARNALVRNAYIRFMHQYEEKEHGHLQGAAFMLSMFISLLLGGVFLLFARPAANALNAPSLAPMLYLYTTSLVVSVFFAQFEIVLNAKMDFKGICWMNCVRQSGLILGIIILGAAGEAVTPAALAIVYLLSVAAGTVTGYVFAKPYLSMVFSGAGGWTKRLWNYGKFVFGNNVCSQLFRSTDNFMTSRFFGTAASGYYNASLRISNLVDMPSAVLADVMFPKAAKFSATDKDSIRSLYEKSVGATLIFSIPALLILLVFPETILRILSSEEFVVAAPILRIAAFFGFILPFLKQFGTVMDATGSPDLNFKVMFAGFLLNIVFNLTGIYIFGMIGAAVGTATTYLVLFLATHYILHKKFGITIQGVFMNTFRLSGELLHTLKGYLPAGKQV